MLTTAQTQPSYGRIVGQIPRYRTKDSIDDLTRIAGDTTLKDMIKTLTFVAKGFYNPPLDSFVDSLSTFPLGQRLQLLEGYQKCAIWQDQHGQNLGNILTPVFQNLPRLNSICVVDMPPHKHIPGWKGEMADGAINAILPPAAHRFVYSQLSVSTLIRDLCTAMGQAGLSVHGLYTTSKLPLGALQNSILTLQVLRIDIGIGQLKKTPTTQPALCRVLSRLTGLREISLSYQSEVPVDAEAIECPWFLDEVLNSSDIFRAIGGNTHTRLKCLELKGWWLLSVPTFNQFLTEHAARIENVQLSHSIISAGFFPGILQHVIGLAAPRLQQFKVFGAHEIGKGQATGAGSFNIGIMAVMPVRALYAIGHLGCVVEVFA
jgi:hypothetical protein